MKRVCVWRLVSFPVEPVRAASRKRDASGVLRSSFWALWNAGGLSAVAIGGRLNRTQSLPLTGIQYLQLVAQSVLFYFTTGFICNDQKHWEYSRV